MSHRSLGTMSDYVGNVSIEDEIAAFTAGRPQSQGELVVLVEWFLIDAVCAPRSWDCNGESPARAGSQVLLDYLTYEPF